MYPPGQLAYLSYQPENYQIEDIYLSPSLIKNNLKYLKHAMNTWILKKRIRHKLIENNTCLFPYYNLYQPETSTSTRGPKAEIGQSLIQGATRKMVCIII